MMQNSFHLSTRLTLFFKELHISKTGDFFALCLVFAVATFLFELLKCLRLRVAEKDDRWKGISCFSKAHALQTFLFMINISMGYIIMLVVMTFNGWLFIAVLIGSAIGYHTCQLLHDHRFMAAQTGGTNQSSVRPQVNKDLNGNDGQNKQLPKGYIERESTV